MAWFLPVGREDVAMTVLAMSHGELSRFDTLMRVERGELRVEVAAALLALKRRQVFRLLDRMRTEGASGLVSRKRGRPTSADEGPLKRKRGRPPLRRLTSIEAAQRMLEPG